MSIQPERLSFSPSLAARDHGFDSFHVQQMEHRARRTDTACRPNWQRDSGGLVELRHVERILFRLSRSAYHDIFVLKGALLFELWTGNKELRF